MIKFYVEYFEKELNVARIGNFTGNLQFNVNFKDGSIGNMNMGVNQSVKYQGGQDERSSVQFKEKT